MADEIRKCADLDERLAPYVDGNDSPPMHRAVEAHVSGCPSCAEHVRDEASARALVHEQRAALRQRAPQSLRVRCDRLRQDYVDRASTAPHAVSNRRETVVASPPSAVLGALRRWAPLSLAATLVLAIAGVFAFGLNDRVQALAASLAVDHVKCFKINGTATTADAHVSEKAWQQDQGWPIEVPQTAPSEELKLVDVRRCFSTDGRAAHLMYTWRGEPLSVYVMQGDGARDRIVRKMGAQAVIWGANRRVYAVVSSDTTRDLTGIVGYMKARVR